MLLQNFYIHLFEKFPVWLLLLLSGFSVIFGDYYAKLWSINTKDLFLFFAFLGYLFSGVFYIPTLLRENLTTTSIIWSLISIFGFLIVGLLIFKESLNLWQKIAIGFGLISLTIFAFNQ